MIPVVSAFLYLEEIVENEIVILALVFLVLFTVIRFALSRSIFRRSNAVSAIIGLCIAALITFALYENGTIEELMYVISTSSQVVVTVVIIAIGIAIIWACVKFIGLTFGHPIGHPRRRGY